jgi:aspartyl-tRNA(Asn)/glutamyl-tRNA(Gln) amidotransferase subunit A
VRDAALALSVMAGFDPRDGYALAEPAPDVLGDLERGVRGLRIGYSPDLGFARVDPEVLACTDEGRRVFAALGARVSGVKLDIGDPRSAADRIFLGLAALIARRLGRRRVRLSDPVLLKTIAGGEKLDALALLEAESTRRDLCARMAAFHTRYDLLITPTAGAAPFDATRDSPPGWEGPKVGSGWMATTFPFDLTGQPAISVPCGFTPGGGPIGLQIVGRTGADALVLRAARAFERAHPVGRMRPPLA